MKKIQIYRQAKGLTRRELAEAIGVTKRAAEAIEHRGVNGVRAEMAVKIAEALGCSVKDLID